MTKINVPDESLRKPLRAPLSDAAREAVQKAEEFARTHDQSELIKYLGTFEDFMTPEELDEMRRMD